MIVQVKLFAVTRDLVGADEVSIELDEAATIADLKTKLLQAHPQLGPVINHVLVAIDSEYAQPDQRILDGAQLALIPPVSGG